MNRYIRIAICIVPLGVLLVLDIILEFAHHTVNRAFLKLDGWAETGKIPEVW